MELLPDPASCAMLCILRLGNLPFWQVEFLLLAISFGKAEMKAFSTLTYSSCGASCWHEMNYWHRACGWNG